jgi:hypothetical protein
MVEANPDLVNDPATISSIANRYGLASDQVVSAMKLNQHNRQAGLGVGGRIVDYGSQLGWGALGLIGIHKDAQGNLTQTHQATPLFNSRGGFDPSMAIHGAKGFVGGAVKGISEIPSAVGTIAKQAVTNPLQILQELFFAPRTLLSATMSEVKRNGWGYALGHLAPSLLAGKGLGSVGERLFGTALEGSDIAAARTAQQIATDQATVEAASTGGLSFEQQAEAAAAAQRLRVTDPIGHLQNRIQTLENAPTTADFESKLASLKAELKSAQETAAKEAGVSDGSSFATSFSKSLEKYKNLQAYMSTGSAIGKGLKIPISAIQAFNRVVGGAPMNIAAIIRMPGIQSDPAIWKAALEGKVVDANGKTTTLGNEISSALLSNTGFFHDIIAKVLDFDTAFVVDDPFVKLFKLRGQAKSAAGFTGTLSRYFGGIGVTHPGDFTRAYQQYGSVRRAVNWIAEHNAAAINDRFRNVFGAKLLLDLEKANTPDAVLSVLEDTFAGMDYVSATAPVMGWFTAFKAALGGKLGERFGTLGNLLASDITIDANIRDAILKEKGYDIAPRNDTYQRLNLAGKSLVLLRQRVRAQFIRMPEHFDRTMGKATSRVVTPGSVEAVNSIADMMRAVYIPEPVINSVCDLLIHSAHDPNAYKRAYRQAMYDVMVRPMTAHMSRAEFDSANKALSDFIWEKVNAITGNDGGGFTGNYLATTEDWRNLLSTPSGPLAAGIGTNHLGHLIIPDARLIKRYQRELLNDSLKLKSYAADQAMLRTDSELNHLVELANFSDKTVEDVIGNLKKGLESKRVSVKELWESDPLHRGYSAQYKSLVKRYEVWLNEGAYKGLTRSEKVALVIKDVENETATITSKFLKLSNDITSRLGVVPPGFDAKAEDIVSFAESLGMSSDTLMTALDMLRGEKQAVEDILANLHSTFNESFDSLNAVLEQAKQVAAMTIKSAEERRKYLQKFKREWERRTEEVPGRNRLTQAAVKRIGGKRNLRSNREMFVDLQQSYLNKIFKPLALMSPGWAMRVSASEAMLNSFRMGGLNFFESHLAASIAKHEFSLGKSMEALAKEGKAEKLMLRNVVAGVMLGLERELLNVTEDAKKARLLNDAVDLMIDHDGHLPMSMVHGSDSLDGDAVQHAVSGAVHGTDAEGNPEVSRMFRGAKHTIIGNNDAGAGTALHENLSMVYSDSIMNVGARFLDGEASASGIAALTLNQESVMKRVVDEAIKRMEGGTSKAGRKSKEVWDARNSALADLRNEVMNMSEFAAANREEQAVAMMYLREKSLGIDTMIRDDVPKYMRATYDAQNRAIANLENSIPRLEADIAKQESLVKEYETQWLASLADDTTPELRLSIGEKLDEADARLRTLGSARTLLDRAIQEHPFRRFYTTLEKGAALNPYKPVLNDLREKLTEKIAASQQATEARIRELLGSQPLALPQGGFADMYTERMLTFKNAAGEAVPNEAAYKELFDKHPELWSDNGSYSKWLPIGMPGVHGRDFLDALGGRAEVADVARLVKHEGDLAALHDALRSNRFKEAYAILDRLDPTSLSEFSPVMKEGVPDLSHATTAFTIDGVSPEIILGHGRTQEKTLADLALLDRQAKSLDVPRMFNKRFFPNYDPEVKNSEGRFKYDFEKHQSALTRKNATQEEKDVAARWFSSIVDPDPGKWATTANKVWKENLQTYLIRNTKVAEREDYYALLEQRKQLSLDRSRVGVEKRQILKGAGLSDSAESVASDSEKQFIEASNKLEAMQAQRATDDAKMARAHAKRDEVEAHVVAQDTAFRDRLAKEASKLYDARVRKGTKGMGAIMRRIDARTATLNKSMEKNVRSVLAETVTGLSAKGLSGEEAFNSLRERLVDHMYAHLHTLPADELARFPRSMFPRMYNSSGDPMRDWADDIAEHLMTLTTGGAEKVFFPEIAKQMAHGDMWGPQKLAHWLSDGIKNAEPRPNHFPARQFVPPFAKGSRTNFITDMSDKMHSKVLGPMVNEMVREPVFVWEYHQQMELLRPKMAQGLLTKDQAKIIASTQASINMGKFVHDPLGKTVWENNWRTVSPFYFAKNQALRRAGRVAGDKMDAFYKYLRLNLAVTDFVAQSSLGQNNFVVPGAEVLSGLGAGITGGIMYALGYRDMTGMSGMNFGLDASPSSVMSIVITGNKAGLVNTAKEMIAIPFAPTVTFPAKLMYQYVAHHNPLVGRILTDILGETAMQSNALDDLMPNTFVRNAAKGMYGFMFQNNTGAYTSSELYVMQDMAQQKFEECYAEAKKDYPTISESDKARFGSKEQLWSFYASQKFSEYFNNVDHMQSFMNAANLRTGFLYTMKSIIGYSSPTAVSIGQRFLKNKDFAAIAKEKDAHGNLKFPTYFLQADEFARRYPDRVFDLIGHTKSAGARWPETAEALKFMEDHWNTVRAMPNASAYLVGNMGTQYENRALQLEYALGTRQRQTPKEFMSSLFVSLGNRYYGTLYDALAADPNNIDKTTGGLNYRAGMELRSMATSYGQTVNPTWLADKNSGRKNNVAFRTYNEMVKMVNDSQYHGVFKPAQLAVYQSLIGLRQQYEALYNERVAAGEKTGALRSEWYAYCDQLSKNPDWKDYSGFVSDVMKNLPNP